MTVIKRQSTISGEYAQCVLVCFCEMFGFGTIDHLHNALHLSVVDDWHTQNVSCLVAGQLIHFRVKSVVSVGVVNVDNLSAINGI